MKLPTPTLYTETEFPDILWVKVYDREDGERVSIQCCDWGEEEEGREYYYGVSRNSSNHIPFTNGETSWDNTLTIDFTDIGEYHNEEEGMKKVEELFFN